jgi:hypothetical protein
MRTVAGVAGLLLAVTLGLGQPPAPPAARYGVRPLPDQFGHAAPKAALESAIRLIERGRFDYLVAHVLDPAFADKEVADRALRLEDGVEREFRRLRDVQRQDPALPGDQRLPDDPEAFRKQVQAESTARGFRQLVADVQRTLAENPDHLADLRRFLRSGQLLEAGDTASFGLKDAKDRAVYLKRSPAGWHLENRRQDVPEKK